MALSVCVTETFRYLKNLLRCVSILVPFINVTVFKGRYKYIFSTTQVLYIFRIGVYMRDNLCLNRAPNIFVIPYAGLARI